MLEDRTAIPNRAKKLINLEGNVRKSPHQTHTIANNLLRLWIYLWKKWYTKNRWNLWARASNEEISHIKTTMIVESHWQHIKHDYLYKFHKPQIDHLCYILVKKVVNQQLHRI